MTGLLVFFDMMLWNDVEEFAMSELPVTSPHD